MTLSDKEKRIRDITLRNTIFACLGYFIPLGATYIAWYIQLADISIQGLHRLALLITVSSVIFITFILLHKRISATSATVLGFLQLMNWVVIYSLWALNLNQIRVIALASSIIALVFLTTYATLKQSLVISFFAIAGYIAISYYSINYLHQAGSFRRELFQAIFFIPAELFISYMSGVFKKQRDIIKKAKKTAEETRDALWGEMEIAKKIQTILLPEKPSIEGYEISVHMMPSLSVGGDYYDVITVKGMDWIIIGDVSGHGVPAGLIMMMVQTSIHVVLDQKPDLAPSEVLSTINSAITKNIKKISADKYMTITVLACHRNGRFTFSGLHQDILVYRAAAGKTEIVETNGLWLGILEDLRRCNDDLYLQLDEGDVLLLYTDGITESLDADGNMFTEENLVRTFNAFGDTATDTIKEAILSALSNYKINDDITMVIIKRNQ